MRRVVVVGVLAVAVASTNGTAPPWCRGPPSSVIDLTSARGAESVSDPGKPVPFIIAMMGPRVGSKMLRSMLEGWGGGNKVECWGEQTEQRLSDRWPGDLTARYRLGKFYGSPDYSKKAGYAALGYKTERLLEYSDGRYGFGPFYTLGDAKNDTLAKLGVRVVCLSRLNVIARMAAGQRKSGNYETDATLACDAKTKTSHVVEHYAGQQARVNAFYAACSALGRSTRTLWVPYEAAKDRSPIQKASLDALQRFLGLKPIRAMRAASDSCEPPAAVDAYVANAAECDAAFDAAFSAECAATYRGMLHDPAWPHGAARRRRRLANKKDAPLGDKYRC